jgi:hypothetical protein
LDERRKYERHAVVWPIRLWISEKCFIAGRSVNGGLHGAWITVSWLPSGVLKLDQEYRLELCPGTSGEFSCTAVVRHVSRHGIGLEILEQVPASLIGLEAPVLVTTGR